MEHPIRMGILQSLQGRVASATELSEQLGTRQGVVSYHAKVLVHYGCLQLVHRTSRGSAVDSYFRLPG